MLRRALPCLLAALASAQEAPKPGPHHAHLARLAGTWDAVVTFWSPAGKPGESVKAAETSTLICGGLWLETDFKAQMGPMPFEGHSLAGYDPVRKRCLSTWVDSTQTFFAATEGTCGPDGAVHTLFGTWPDDHGRPLRWKEVEETQGDDARTFTMYRAKGRGWVKVMTIEYTRRK